MKKSISVSISGIAFTFEYDAFERLKDYLSLLKDAYRDEEASTEIIADIEARISELVLSWQSVNDEIVTLECIDSIIEQMGQPEVEPTSDKDDKDDKDGKGITYSDVTSDSRISSRLYRNSDGSKLGGVINGFATYFGKDVTLFRILFVGAIILLSIATSGFAILFTVGVYILLWVIIPLARNARQKMEMRGNPITVQTLKQNIEDELDGMNPSVVNSQVSSIFSQILLVSARIIRFIIISLSMVIGVVLTLALVATIGFTVFSFVNYQGLVPLFASHNSIFVISTLSISVITTLVMLIYVIAKLAFSFKYNKAIVTFLSALLILSWGVSSYVIVDNQLDFIKKYSSVVSSEYTLPTNELHISPSDRYCYGHDDFDFRDGVFRTRKRVYLKVDNSLPDSTIKIDYLITTCAASTSEAIDTHDTSDANHVVKDGYFKFDEYTVFSCENKRKYKSRSATITIWHPESMVIHNDYRNYIYTMNN